MTFPYDKNGIDKKTKEEAVKYAFVPTALVIIGLIIVCIAYGYFLRTAPRRLDGGGRLARTRPGPIVASVVGGAIALLGIMI